MSFSNSQLPPSSPLSSFLSPPLPPCASLLCFPSIRLLASAVLGAMWVWHFRIFLPSRQQQAEIDAQEAALNLDPETSKGTSLFWSSSSSSSSLNGNGVAGCGNGNDDRVSLDAKRGFFQAPFRIREDGARVDEKQFGRPWSQTILHLFITLPGAIILLFCTSSLFVSLLLLLLVGSLDWLCFQGHQYFASVREAAPSRRRKLQSQRKYEKSGKRTTKRELEKLRRYLKENPDDMMLLHPDSELLARR